TLVDEPIKTFSVAFAEREANELEYARLVAQAYKTDHHEIVVTPEQFWAKLPDLIWHEDEPLAHPSSVALYFVSHLASQHVKVVLTGEGSDELMAGYARYRKTILNLALGEHYHRVVPSGVRDLVRKQFSGMTGSKLRLKLGRTFLNLTPDIESIYFDNFSVFSRSLQQQLLTSDAMDQTGGIDPYAGVRDVLRNTDAQSLLDRLLYADIKTYLHELLMKQDQMSMAASVESRVPFLDHKLVEFTSSLPERLKLRRWTTKYVLRQSMKGVLPPAILDRPKMGFPVPLGKWFRGAYAPVLDEYVLSSRAIERGIFNAEFVRSLVDQHRGGVANHSERLWSLVNLEMWFRRFIDGENAGANLETADESMLATARS
ncbi:MAG TPA: asparagine synthase-related protein, partial [Pyrinomonadaceae bacterium]